MGGSSGAGTGGSAGSGGIGGDSCAESHGGCDLLTTCDDSGGSVVCGSCPNGYTGNGTTGCVAVTCTGAPGVQCPCVKVAPDGDDAAALASHGLEPFANVEPAIDFASAHPEVAVNVCVASGAGCAASFSYPTASETSLEMRNGIGVYGKYESAGWTRCSDSVTTLAPASGLGVVFGPEIDSDTRLDGFSIKRLGTETSAGVTVGGAQGAHLVDLRIRGEVYDPAWPMNVSAVDAFGGAVLTIERSSLESRYAIASTVALRVTESNVTLVDSVLEARGDSSVTALWLEESEGLVQGSSLTTLDSSFEHADGSVALRSLASSVLVRDSSLSATGESLVVAVWLEDSAGSVVEDSVVVTGDTRTGGTVNAVRVRGDSEGVTLAGNEITGQNGDDTTAVLVEACEGSSLEIAQNDRILATRPLGGTPNPEAIRVDGACTVRIWGNAEIASVAESAPVITAIHCAEGSSCTILDNPDIYNENSNSLFTEATGILCEDGACDEISGNGVNGLRFAPTCSRSCAYRTRGIDIQGGSPFLSRNNVKGGCGDQTHGVRIIGATARLENNVIFGRTSDCDTGLPEATLTSFGLVGDTLDVHSNVIDGGGSSVTLSGCTSTGVQAEGVFRNNVLRGGSCETSVPAALTGIASNNLPDCEFSVFPHLAANSSCIDAGTPDGAPLFDIDGDPRDDLPDVGVDEWLQAAANLR